MVRVEDDVDVRRVASKMFVDRIVYNLPNAVMKCRSVVWIAQIHTGSFSYGLKAFENLNAGCAVFVCQNYSSAEFLLGRIVPKKSVFFEVILGRSALLFAPLSPLQTYPVPRGYKGSAMGRSKDANCRHIIEVENGFF